MPSHYAHYRLGRQVRLELTPDAAEVVGRWPSLYLIGLHGPDILFYYRGYRENPVNRLGYALHGETGEAFVRWAMQVIAAHPGQDAHRAYAYGVLCHFALDESCHSIVARQMAAGARLLLHTDLAVSTTGVAGPDKDDFGNDVGTVYIALADGAQSWCYLCHFQGSRSKIRTAAADFALSLTVRYLAGDDLSEGAL